MEVLAPGSPSEQAEGQSAVAFAAEGPGPEEHPGSVSRRYFLAGAGAAAVGMVLYAGEISRHELVTEHRSIAIEQFARKL